MGGGRGGGGFGTARTGCEGWNTGYTVYIFTPNATERADLLTLTYIVTCIGGEGGNISPETT